EIVDRLHLFDGPPARLGQARVVVTERALNGVDDIRRGEGRPVMAQNAFVQREGDLPAVLADVPVFGQGGNKVSLEIELQQGVIVLIPGHAGERGRGTVRIARVDIAIPSPDARILLRLRVVRVDAYRGNGGTRQHHTSLFDHVTPSLPSLVRNRR